MFKQVRFALGLGFLILLLDIVSKAMTYHTLPLMGYGGWEYPYGGIGVFENWGGIEFSIVHVTNTGVAWGWLADFQVPLLVIRIFLIFCLLIYASFYQTQKSKIIPLFLVLAGAIGNVLDTFIYGKVIDMFHFILWGYDFPVFNVADIAICTGIFFFCLFSYDSKEKQIDVKKAFTEP